MISGVFPFPPKDLSGGESAEIRLELTEPFRMAYIRASAYNVDDVWLTDILIGEKSLMPKEARSSGVPLELFFSMNLTFDDEVIPRNTPIRIQAVNRSKELRNVRLALFGSSVKGPS